MKSFAELALAYFAAGWRIHPLWPREKRPLLRAWPQHCYREAAAVVAAWRYAPESNIGLITGPHPNVADTLVAFDCDGDRFLQRAQAILPPTPAQTISGSGHGGHMFYRWAPGVPCSATEKLERGAASAHEELAFHGTCANIVLPGSIHPDTGERYRWVHAPDDPGAIPPAASLPIVGPAELAALRTPKSVSKRRVGERTRRVVDGAPGECLEVMMRACESKGLAPRLLNADKFAIECPWRSAHSGGAQGDSDSAVLTGPQGHLHYKCFHSHCSERKITDLCEFLGLPLPGYVRPALKRFPPESEVRALLASIESPFSDLLVAAMLERQGADPQLVWQSGLAGALPRGNDDGLADRRAPGWARVYRQSWYDAGYRLMMPLWAPDPGAVGLLREVAVLAAAVHSVPGHRAYVTPSGHSCAGAVLAPRPDFLVEGADRKLLTVTVEPDRYLQLALRRPSFRGALLGSLPGSATTELMALVPQEWQVLVVAPPNANGDAAARAWRRRAEDRGCAFRRIAA